MRPASSLVLDTMVARGFGEGDVEIEPFLAIKRRGIRVHLADGAATELMAQIVEGRLAWPKWIRARTRLEKLLDHEDPVLLGGREGLIWRGVQSPVGDELAKVPEQRAAVRAIWRAMRKAGSLSSMRRERTHRIAGRFMRVPVEVDEASTAVNEMRSEWADSFARIFDETLRLIPNAQQALPARGQSPEALEHIVRDLCSRYDSDFPTSTSPPMSERLDAMIRVYSLLALRKLRPKEPYNAEKNANDVFDHDILRYLAHPAAICSRDRGLHADLEASNTKHRRWVLKPDELESPDILERLEGVHF